MQVALSRGFSSEQIGQVIVVGRGRRCMELGTRTNSAAGLQFDFAELGLLVFAREDAGVAFRVGLRFWALCAWFSPNDDSEKGTCDREADWAVSVKARGCCFPGLVRGDWLLALVSDSNSVRVVGGVVAVAA